MEITGRLTKDAEVKTLLDERQLVTFSIAVNDYFKKKDGEKVNAVEYFNCAYWQSAAIAKALTKGSIVSCYGRIELNYWKDKGGEPHASLNFHVNHIRIVAKGKGGTTQTEPATPKPKTSLPTGATDDDLPF